MQTPQTHILSDYSRGTSKINRKYFVDRDNTTMHRQTKKPKLITIVLSLVTFVILLVLAWQAALFFFDNASSPSNSAAISTPKSEWVQGKAPYLYQTDPAWAKVGYAENSFNKSGCGPTCMSMVYVMMTGRTDMDPGAMASYATRNGYASEDGTSWLFMTGGAEDLGLNPTPISSNVESIRKNLLKGNPIICSVGPGDFTKEGHFIVLVGIDSQGQVEVRDPNSMERSGKTWSVSRILDQSVALWAYEDMR